MSLIDHILKFPDEATAQADKIVGAYWNAGDKETPGSWRGDVCIPGVVLTQISTGKVDPSWCISISLPDTVTDLADHPATLMVTDRDTKANAGKFVKSYALDSKDLADFSTSPVFAGVSIPFGDAKMAEAAIDAVALAVSVDFGVLAQKDPVEPAVGSV